MICHYLIEWIVDAGISFVIVERPSFWRLLNAIRPGASDAIPSRKEVAGPMLQERYEAAKSRQEKNLEAQRDNRNFLAMMMDGYKNISRNHLNGVMLLFARFLAAVEAAIEGSDHDGNATARSVEALFA